MLLVSARRQTITDRFKSSWRAARVSRRFSFLGHLWPIAINISAVCSYLVAPGAGLPRQPSAPRLSQTAKIGPWQRFLQAKRRGTKHTMKEIADQCSSLSAEQKRMWQQPAAPPPVPVPVPVRPAAQVNGGHSVWPKCGDDFYVPDPGCCATYMIFLHRWEP